MVTTHQSKKAWVGMIVLEDEERRLWFRRQVLPLEPQLRRYAARFAANSLHDPDDLVHETFASLIAYARWRDIQNVHGFAVSTLRNVVLQAARRRKIVQIHALSDLQAVEIPDESPNAQRIIEGRDELAMLQRLIDALPDQCGRVFKLHKIHGLSHAEIAGQLGLSISTIEKHIVKGLRICSEGLARGRAASKPRGQDESRYGGETSTDQRRGGPVGRAPDRLVVVRS